MMQTQNEAEILVSFADLWQICKDSKRKILFGAIFFACLTGFYALTRPIEYEATGTFREKARSQSGTAPNSLTAILLNNNGSSIEAISMLKSRKILERVVKKLGLQATIAKKEMRFNTLANIRDNLTVEFASLKNKPGLYLLDTPPEIIAQDITYLGDAPLSLHLQFASEDVFKFIDSENLEEGRVGVPFTIKEADFTIARSTTEPLTSLEYNLTIQPSRNVVQALLNKIKIDTDKDDKTLLKLKYSHGDRRLASAIINTLMLEYQAHLGEEQQQILREQVSYLQVRQDRMQLQLQRMMGEYAETLTSDLTSIGFPDSNKAMDFLAMRQGEYAKELLSLELEHKRLQKIQNEGSSYYVSETSEQPILISDAALEINASRHKALTTDRKIPDGMEFQGLNLETAEELYVDYSKQLNALEGDILQQRFILDQMQDPEFEVSSLSTILNDSVSNDMVSKASTLLLSLRDHRNRSAKDQERLKNELAIQKGFLAVHLKQTMQLSQLREKLLKGKIQALLNITLGLIKQERDVIEQHQQELQQEMVKLPKKWVSEKLIDQQMDMNKRMVEEITRLVESKNITSNLELIQSTPVDAALAPLKPLTPKILLFIILGAFFGAAATLGFAMVQSIMTGIKVTQGNLKIAHQNVLGILSKQYQKGLTQPFADQDLSTFRRLILFLENQRTREESERSSWLPHSGQNALLIIGQAPDYSDDIATLMAKKNMRILLLPISFDMTCPDNQQPGLLQYLEGKTSSPNIQKMDGYDMISPGGICRYANESIGSRRFSDLLLELQEKYDWILAVTHTKPNSAEAESLLRIFNCAVITVTDQKWHELESCLATTGKQQRAFVLT